MAQQPQEKVAQPKSTRKKNPSYAVFRLHDHEDGHYILLAEQVEAPTREAAVKHTTAEEGTFLVVPAKAVSQHKRTVEQTTIDKFE